MCDMFRPCCDATDSYDHITIQQPQLDVTENSLCQEISTQLYMVEYIKHREYIGELHIGYIYLIDIYAAILC